MTISVLLVAQIIFAHWFSDFVLQSGWMATNKSKNWLALSSHVAVYTVAFALTMLSLSTFIGMNETGTVQHAVFVLTPYAFATWIALNGVLHFVTDAVTSRITSRLWAKGDMHNFFVVVGLDQMIHYFCLFGTFVLLVS